jgi:hypothetical protein
MNLPRLFRRSVWALLLVLLSGLAVPVAAQQKLLTLDDLLDPQKRVDFSGTVPVVTWLDDTTYLWAKGDRMAPPELLA